MLDNVVRYCAPVFYFGRWTDYEMLKIFLFLNPSAGVAAHGGGGDGVDQGPVLQDTE